MNVQFFKLIRKLKPNVEYSEDYEREVYQIKHGVMSYRYAVTFYYDKEKFEVATNMPATVQEEYIRLMESDLTQTKKEKLYESFKKCRRAKVTQSNNMTEYQFDVFYFRVYKHSLYEDFKLEFETNVTSKTYANLQRYLKR